MATSMGVIVFGLPYNLLKSGLWVGIFFLVQGACISFLTLDNIMYVGFKKNLKKYSDCVYEALGYRAGWLCQWVIIIYIFCCITNFQMTGEYLSSISNNTNIACIGAEFIRKFLVNIGVEREDYTQLHRAGQILLCACVIFPISCLRDLHAIRHTTIAVVFSTLYILVVAALQY